VDHEDIGKVVGVDRVGVAQIANNFNTKLFYNEYESSLTPEKIASNHNLDEVLVWAILLEGGKVVPTSRSNMAMTLRREYALEPQRVCRILSPG
jgi:hypothetical protein